MCNEILKDILSYNDYWYLSKLGEVPYINDKDVFAIYYFSKSSNKAISTLLEYTRDYNNTNNIINQVGKDIIANIIYKKFSLKWLKLYETYEYKYDIGKPFSMSVKEDVTDNLESEENNNSNRTNNDTTVDKTLNSEEKTNDYIYGFNSLDKVNSDESVNTFKDENENTYTGNEVFNKSNSYSRNSNIVRNTNRDGNIGNIPVQELINKEREVWKYQLWDIICEDLDSVLTRKKYFVGE